MMMEGIGLLLYAFTLILGIIPVPVQCTNDTNRTVPDFGCYELSPPFYGVLVYNNTLVGRGQSQPTWRENDTVTFLCDRGYELVGGSDTSLGVQWSITCESNGTDNMINDATGNDTSNVESYGVWSEEPEQFECARIDCGQPPVILNGSASLDAPNTTDLFSTAHYSCDTGYQFSDGRDYSVCWWNGTWHPDTISCDPIPTIIVCGDPPLISNGARTWAAGDQAAVGTMVTYSCDSGYEREGAEKIACTVSGQWTDPPTCSASAFLSSTEIYIIEGAASAAVISLLSLALCFFCCFTCKTRIKQRRYVEDEEALATSGAFTLSNPLVTVKDEDAAGNPLYLTPDELNEFEQQQ